MQKLTKSNRSVLGCCCPWERVAWSETSLCSELCQRAACCAPLKSCHPTPPSWSVQPKILRYVLWSLTPSSISATIVTNHRLCLLHICPRYRLPISLTSLSPDQDWFKLLKFINQLQGCSYIPVSLRYFTVLASVMKSLLLSLLCFMNLQPIPISSAPFVSSRFLSPSPCSYF